LLLLTGKPVSISGLILFNKPSGITSFDALRDIKRALGTGKVGHTGTLDKFAQGLLVVLVGKALKLSRWFTNCDKKYIGKIHFGIETDTLDPEGNVIAEAAIPTKEEVEQALFKFTGKIKQEPPAYSAIHINGKRASELARSGDLPEMKKRLITIYRLELLSWQPPFADIFVHCSSGTYIRSLARDIALAVGSRGYLCELVRTQVGKFQLKEKRNRTCGSEKREQLIENFTDPCSEPEIRLLPINKEIICALGMPWVEVTQQEAEYISHGKPIEILLSKKQLFFNQENLEGNDALLTANCDLQTIAVFYEDRLIAIVEKKDGDWKYGCVI
jgi:tRNA pseudouridine55 synthase